MRAFVPARSSPRYSRGRNPQATAAEIDAEKRKLADAPLVTASSVHQASSEGAAVEQDCPPGECDEHRTAATALGLRRVLATAGSRSIATYSTPRIEGGRKARRFCSHRHAVEPSEDRPRPRCRTS